jgi:hypothetical protein
MRQCAAVCYRDLPGASELWALLVPLTVPVSEAGFCSCSRTFTSPAIPESWVPLLVPVVVRLLFVSG